MIAQLMEAMLQEPASSPKLWWETMATALVLRLLRADRAVAPARMRMRGGIAPRALRRVQDYIMANLAAEIGLEELAAIAGLSPYHFCRAFKQSTGLPPHGWIVARRIERAKELMATHAELGLLEIALCVGYQNQSTFGKSFSRMVGMTPGRWRRTWAA